MNLSVVLERKSKTNDLAISGVSLPLRYRRQTSLWREYPGDLDGIRNIKI
ncbi:MAG: hypothetical protein V7K67_05355 [Nostoc sp.]